MQNACAAVMRSMTRWLLRAAAALTTPTGIRHGCGPFLQPIALECCGRRQSMAAVLATRHPPGGPAQRMRHGF
jgi:hypothetical protein